jgi:hypothetical protein
VGTRTTRGAWSLYFITCRLLARDGLNYSVTLALDAKIRTF